MKVSPACSSVNDGWPLLPKTEHAGQEAAALESLPLISVVIPCYNPGRFLAKTLESVVRQGYQSAEIIAVDDGSTEHQGFEALGAYSSITCIRQPNDGVAAARNAGLRHSKGDFVVFLDQDDRLLPGALEANLRCLLDHADAGFVFGDTRVIDETGAPLPLRPPPPYDDSEPYVSLLYANHIWTPGAVMYPRAALEMVTGFDSAMGPAADLDLNLRIARRLPVLHNRREVLEYRIHDAAGSRDSAAMLVAGIKVLRKEKQWARHNPHAMRALQHGLQVVQSHHGNLLLSQLAADIRQRTHWRRVAVGLALLLRYAPLVTWQRLSRRGRRLGWECVRKCRRWYSDEACLDQSRHLARWRGGARTSRGR